jgi:NAD(P)H-dependent FMN reductase
MATIVGVCGSLRRASFNMMLLRAVAEAMPAGSAIDRASRPPSDVPRVFRGRPVAVIGSTTGLGATRLAQAAWLPVLRTLGMRPWFEGPIMIPGAAKVFDAEGRLVDRATRDRVRAFAEGFAAWTARAST